MAARGVRPAHAALTWPRCRASKPGPALAALTWDVLSRSRTVTLAFSSASKSTVTANGTPISSVRAYLGGRGRPREVTRGAGSGPARARMSAGR